MHRRGLEAFGVTAGAACMLLVVLASSTGLAQHQHEHGREGAWKKFDDADFKIEKHARFVSDARVEVWVTLPR